jgi:acyl-CoA thioesterase FadM
MAALQRAFVVRRHVATYYHEAKLGDVLIAKTWAHSFSGPRCLRDVEIFRDDLRIFHCQTEWVWINISQRSPKRITPEIQTLFSKQGLGFLAANE